MPLLLAGSGTVVTCASDPSGETLTRLVDDGLARSRVTRHRGSDVQLAVQRSAPLALPSSPCSLPPTRPSPQPGVHTLGAPAQAYPGSIVQTTLQPSAPVALPSSQRSLPATMPSPQPGVQTLGAP